MCEFFQNAALSVRAKAPDRHNVRVKVNAVHILIKIPTMLSLYTSINPRTLILVVLLPVLLLLLAACSQSDPTLVTKVVQVYVTATPVPSSTPTTTPSPTLAPTATPTSTATPTLTPTAQTAILVGDPRGVRLSEPVSQQGARCGMVDVLDFPLNPPDAENTMGGGDFGVYRERYQGNHTGEDWGLNRSRNMDAPVYSIGHGMVTYAQPRGWGRDGGVVIVQHVLSDWSRVLSFYGHLDPDSVDLRMGDCVQRGDMVGKIGDRQHLHFEIRVHMPKQPGPGYWSVDPSLAGWKPPSKFILEQRVRNAPGVDWMGDTEVQSRRGLGMLDDGAFVGIEDDELVGLNPVDGELHWRFPLSSNVSDGAIDINGELVYLANRAAVLEAYRLAGDGSDTSSINSGDPLEPQWRIDFGGRGPVKLIPLIGGGVLLSMDGEMYAVSRQGELLWELEAVRLVSDWAMDNERLIFTNAGEEPALWMVEDGALTELATGVNGRPVVAGERVYLYDQEGVYRVNMAARSLELLYPLAEAYRGQGEAVALPEGGLLLVHRDVYDRRLVVFNADGSLRWQRSFADVRRAEVHLLPHAEQTYVVMVEDGAHHNTLSVMQVDLESGELRRVFEGGTRGSVLRNSWVQAAGEHHLLINMGGVLLALDPVKALDIISAGQ